MRTAFDAVNVLRWHFGMIGQPKSAQPPQLEPFEQAFGLALGVGDAADFECLCPVLIFNQWEPQALADATPSNLRGRLRLAAGIGIFFTDYSRLGMPWPMATTVALKRLAALTQAERLDRDAWNDPQGANEPDGLYLEFFKPYGLYVHWPLADFLKQYNWARIRNEERLGGLMESAATAQLAKA
ncbi:hypothetical protein SBV1_760002 [Verrucomicrobia bacterium]|nr:hypothetical protein SBV1_760002 [Verrucomicrobiota bacterium]